MENINYDDFTIMFTGYNVKNTALLAIRSFQHFYPEFKNICYFDDYSSDGSEELLKSEGIKCISWNIENYYNFLSCTDYFNSIEEEKMRDIATVCTRVSYMYNSCMKQVGTKYILFMHADSITLKRGLLFQEIEYLKENKIVSLAPNLIMKSYRDRDKENRYVPYFEGDKAAAFISFYLLIDLEYFKSIGRYGDLLDEYNIQAMGYVIDTLTDFNCFCYKNNIPVKKINLTNEVSYFLHLPSITSGIRYKDLKKENTLKVIQILKKFDIDSLISEINIDKSYKINLRNIFREIKK